MTSDDRANEALTRIAEALERLALLSREGAGPAAFDFRQRFTPDGAAESVRRVAVSG